jgi:hypothetical protein
MQNHISLSQGNKTYTDSLKDNEEGTKAKQQGDSTISLTLIHRHVRACTQRV